MRPHYTFHEPLTRVLQKILLKAQILENNNVVIINNLLSGLSAE